MYYEDILAVNHQTMTDTDNILRTLLDSVSVMYIISNNSSSQ